jgi:hypothetical protein
LVLVVLVVVITMAAQTEWILHSLLLLQLVVVGQVLIQLLPVTAVLVVVALGAPLQEIGHLVTEILHPLLHHKVIMVEMPLLD